MANSFHITQNVHLCFFLLLIPSSVDALNFELSRFNTTNLLYQGDASSIDGIVELNKVNYPSRVGWVTYPDKIRIWESSTGKVSDFTTRFSFRIHTDVAPSHGHGLAFFLAPAGIQIPPNSAGGFLGLFNTTTMNLNDNQIVHVEFDSYPNSIEWDPAEEHVGINIHSLNSSVYTRWNASFHSGDTADVRIVYNSSTMNLSVSWIYPRTSNLLENSSLSYRIDLSKVLPEWVTIGFSAATGSGQIIERHALESWEFNSSLDAKETMDEKTSNKTTSIIASSVAVSTFVLIVGAVLAFLFWWRRKRMDTKSKRSLETGKTTSINEDFEKGAYPRRFSYEELVLATNNFSGDRKLGEGGFGAVYKGYWAESTEIAVKKISSGSKQGKKEYVTEVKTIGQLRHRNLVQLIGWSHDRGEFMLVYEFMPNGSLNSHLFSNNNTLLPWDVRYKISLGLASALFYLHEGWEQCVVHRDIKPSNIMLDSSFAVKLGDFGLARLMDHEIDPKTTGLAGTFGYLAPEYISTGRASKESDVYSFGVVALELASGRKATDLIEVQESEFSLVEWIWDLYGCNNLRIAVDGRLVDLDENQAERLMIVGLWCAHPDHRLRPSIRQAAQVLNFETAVPTLPAKMPVPVFQVPKPSFSSTEPSVTTSSVVMGR